MQKDLRGTFCHFTSFSFFHIPLLATSRNGAISYYAFQGLEFPVVYPGIDIVLKGELPFLVPVCYELVEQPVDEFLQCVIYPAGICVIEVVCPACDQIIDLFTASSSSVARFFLLRICFAFSSKFPTAFLDGWNMVTFLPSLLNIF